MTYQNHTSSYNEKRYGKPWVGILQGKMLTKDYVFVPWDGIPGHVGIHEFEAEPGQIIAYGQKDHRKNRGGIDGYMICLPDGSLAELRGAMEYRNLSFAERVEKFLSTRTENL